jgi:hypothetical protein
VQERERERRNCSLPPDYDTDVPGMPDLIPTNKNKGSPRATTTTYCDSNIVSLSNSVGQTDPDSAELAKLKMRSMKL